MGRPEALPGGGAWDSWGGGPLVLEWHTVCVCVAGELQLRLWFASPLFFARIPTPSSAGEASQVALCSPGATPGWADVSPSALAKAGLAASAPGGWLCGVSVGVSVEPVGFAQTRGGCQTSGPNNIQGACRGQEARTASGMVKNSPSVLAKRLVRCNRQKRSLRVAVVLSRWERARSAGGLPPPAVQPLPPHPFPAQ